MTDFLKNCLFKVKDLLILSEFHKKELENLKIAFGSENVKVLKKKQDCSFCEVSGTDFIYIIDNEKKKVWLTNK